MLKDPVSNSIQGCIMPAFSNPVSPLNCNLRLILMFAFVVLNLLPWTMGKSMFYTMYRL